MREVTIANIIKLISNDNMNKKFTIFKLVENGKRLNENHDLQNISYYSHSVPRSFNFLALVKVFSNWCNNFSGG
ncbi:CFC_collapsed_G0053600.mRNA.1.CDS.1 [Saccharomyces cerevisiae]|nr:CFC_collapsed_G0053600.mRNA.1.CDS.1 [Saccharomyces cerevisiae]